MIPAAFEYVRATSADEATFVGLSQDEVSILDPVDSVAALTD
jgi:hypothetical protein